MMKQTVIGFIGGLVCLAGCAGGGDTAETLAARKSGAERRARTAVQVFMQTLLRHLTQKLNEEGPAGAIRYCASNAQGLTRQIAADHRMTLNRVSLKTRNPLSEPDAYDRKVLDEFDRLNKIGHLDAETVHSEVTDYEGKEVLRYLKPIKIQTLCLDCHGPPENLDPAVSTVLKEIYPADRATGYKVGDLRGAVSVIVPLEE